LSSNLHITAAAPAVNASKLCDGKVAMAFGELVVVPMTCLRQRPASFLIGFDLVDDFDMCDVGVNRTPQGPRLNRGFVGVAMAAASEVGACPQVGVKRTDGRNMLKR
jgi:hypothetical protein